NSCLSKVPKITHMVGLSFPLEANEPRIEIIDDWNAVESSESRRGNIELLTIRGRNLCARFERVASVEGTDDGNGKDGRNVPVAPIIALVGTKVLEQVWQTRLLTDSEYRSDQFLAAASIRKYLICELCVEGYPREVHLCGD